MKKVNFNTNLPLNILRDKKIISDFLINDEFIICLNGNKESFFICFQDYLQDNFNYCDIYDLCSGGAEPLNDEKDGTVIINHNGLVENWVYQFHMPETELTDGQSKIPIKVFLKGYIIEEDENYFIPIEMEWNEDSLKNEKLS